MRTAIVIPARYGSQRLPGKPLLRGTGKYLIENTGYGHSNRKAFELAAPEHVKALDVTDPVKHLANGIFFQPVEAAREAKYVKLWEECKAL